MSAAGTIREMEIEYRWLTDDEILELFNPACAVKGWAALNVNPAQPTCRVMGAFWDGVLVEAFALQFHPVLGPLLKIEQAFRDDGQVARTLADKMEEYMLAAKARGALTICESPVAARLADRHKRMRKILEPVYLWLGEGA